MRPFALPAKAIFTLELWKVIYSSIITKGLSSAAPFSAALAWFVERGADPNAPIGAGQMTPMSFAAYHNDESMVHALVSVGADPLVRNTDGHTPRDLTIDAGYHDLAERLVILEAEFTFNPPFPLSATTIADAPFLSRLRRLVLADRHRVFVMRPTLVDLCILSTIESVCRGAHSRPPARSLRSLPDDLRHTLAEYLDSKPLAASVRHWIRERNIRDIKI